MFHEVLKFRLEIFSKQICCHLSQTCWTLKSCGHFSRGGQIPSDPYSSDPGPSDNQDIETMCISPAEETLAVSTDRGQLYSVSLAAADIDQVKVSPGPEHLRSRLR